MALSSTGQIKVTRCFLVLGRIGQFSGTCSTEGGVWSALHRGTVWSALHMGGGYVLLRETLSSAATTKNRHQFKLARCSACTRSKCDINALPPPPWFIAGIKMFSRWASSCNRGPCRATLDRAGPPRPRPALESGLSRQAPNLCYSETGVVKKASCAGRTHLWCPLHTPHVERASYPPHMERARYPPPVERAPENRPIRPNTRGKRVTLMRAPYPAMERAPYPPICGARA